jgi:predicted GNAT superfamily acetyltransferase
MQEWHYRSLEGASDIGQVLDFEVALQQEGSSELVLGEILYAGLHSGGLLVGAYDNERLIGTTFAFPGRRGKTWTLWSAMTAVLPEYRNQGVGFGLKQFERSWALRQGYMSIAWAFDPFQASNANFSFHRLGALSDIYHENFTGEMAGEADFASPSDRLEIIWKLRDRRVKALLVEKSPEFSSDMLAENDDAFLLKSDADCQPIVDPLFANTPSRCYVQIPSDISSIRRTNPALALDWHKALRESFRIAFSHGFKVSDFVKQAERCWYVLTASAPWFLYVLECADSSLYTGITPNLERRVKLHNTGRGAAYTATRRPVKWVAAWRFKDRPLALSAESAFKKLSRPLKLRILKEQSPYRGELFISPS